MTYTFDPTDGDSFDDLQARVVFNSFNETRYTEFVKRALNDAVTEVCRKVGLFETHEVLAFAGTTGLVADPTLPWVRIQEVWATTARLAAGGESAFAAGASWQLGRITPGTLGDLQVGSGPLFYIVRRRKAVVGTGFAPKLDVIVAPPPASAGFVAVKGLQRPAVMTAAGDVSGLGAEFDKAIVSHAKAACFDNEDDFEAAAIWNQRFTDAIRDAVEGDVDEDGPDVVDGTWDC